jgi:hypothetical protein
MNLTMALTIEERLKKNLNDYMRKNPMPELSHRKMFYLKFIDNKLDEYYEAFLEDKNQLVMTEGEIRKTLEYVQLKMGTYVQDF